MSYELILGSLGPVFPLTLTENSEAFPLDAINDTVLLRYVDPAGDIHEVTMDITSAAAGEVEYQWVDGDLPEVGVYKGQVTVERALDVTFPRIFPSSGEYVLFWVHRAI